MNYKLDSDLKYTWKNRPKPSPIKLDRICNVPTYAAVIDRQGRVFHCECDGWMPFPSGNILDFASIDQIYNNHIQQKLAHNTLNGNFKFCSSGVCWIKSGSVEGYKTKLIVNLDNSCNLQCPSCRETLIFHKQGPVYDLRRKQFDHLSKLINNYSNSLTVIVAGDGDAFASVLYRDFLYSIKKSKNLQFVIKTNGLLVDKRLHTYPIANQIDHISVSIDAASENTYKRVRYPGNWNILVRNLDYLKQHEYKLEFNFIIQKDNLHEVQDFVKLCNSYQARPSFSQLEDWGTWHNFSEYNVFDSTHQQYDQCCEVVDWLRSQGLGVT